MTYKFIINKLFESSFKEFVLNIKFFFEKENKSIHKARNELKIINHNNLNMVVKSFKKPHIINRIVYTFFKDSKAKKSYDFSVKINDFTPSPIAYIIFYEMGLITSSYFISEEFKYDFTIREPLLNNNFEDKENILKAFARFTYTLHEKKIFHQDYSPGNILIKKENRKYFFKIVDINRMKFVELDFEDRAKSFSKLWASDDELRIIAKEYNKFYNTSKDFVKKVCYYSNKNKKIKNLKKRLKGIEVKD